MLLMLLTNKGSKVLPKQGPRSEHAGEISAFLLSNDVPSFDKVPFFGTLPPLFSSGTRVCGNFCQRSKVLQRSTGHRSSQAKSILWGSLYHSQHETCWGVAFSYNAEIFDGFLEKKKIFKFFLYPNLLGSMKITKLKHFFHNIYYIKIKIIGSKTFR